MRTDLPAFKQKCEKILGNDLLNTPGNVFYSPTESLSSGEIYLLGLNPGGGLEPNPWTIRNDLETFVKGNERNRYWNDPEPWGRYEPRNAPLQIRIRELLVNLIGDDIKARNVCAANLIFKQSPNARCGNIWKEISQYWKVHQLVLDIVRPRLIVTIGNGGDCAFSFLKYLSHRTDEKHEPSGHGSWKLKTFRDNDALIGAPVIIVGLPHLSRYKPTPKALSWIYARYQEALELPRHS